MMIFGGDAIDKIEIYVVDRAKICRLVRSNRSLVSVLESSVILLRTGFGFGRGVLPAELSVAFLIVKSFSFLCWH